MQFGCALRMKSGKQCRGCDFNARVMAETPRRLLEEVPPKSLVSNQQLYHLRMKEGTNVSDRISFNKIICEWLRIEVNLKEDVS